MSDDIDRLLDEARRVSRPRDDDERQRRSFAYGNAHIENANVTRRMVDEAAERLEHD